MICDICGKHTKRLIRTLKDDSEENICYECFEAGR